MMMLKVDSGSKSKADKLRQAIESSLALVEIQDLDLLLERALLVARNLVNADAGSVYIIEGDKLRFSQVQNDTLSRELGEGKKLIYDSFLVPLDQPSIAAEVVKSGKIRNIADVRKLPDWDNQYDEASGYQTQSVLAIPLKTGRGKVIGVLELINAQDEPDKIISFDKELEPIVRYLAHNAAMAIEHAKLVRTAILRTIKMAELRDPKETGSHVNRVAALSVELYEAGAKAAKKEPREICRVRDNLRMAAMLHDVGKVGISDIILQKPGRLTEEEFAEIKKHANLGALMFIEQDSEVDKMAYEIALSHHERWDGNGYPQKLAGQNIPLPARIVAVADVFDALSSRRVYKEAWEETRVLEELQKQAGSQFDPVIVKTFFQIIEVARSITKRYQEKE